MPRQLLHNLELYALLDEPATERVPQAVQDELLVLLLTLTEKDRLIQALSSTLKSVCRPYDATFSPTRTNFFVIWNSICGSQVPVVSTRVAQQLRDVLSISMSKAKVVVEIYNIPVDSKCDIEKLQPFEASHLFGVLASKYAAMVEGMNSSFELLTQIEDVIHVNVRKLYPDAELPTFRVEQPSLEELVLHYQSERGLADFAEGLMNGCFAHFGETVDLQREDVSGGSATSVIFRLKKQ